MQDKYEVNVTVGVRQVNMGPATFQASDTFMIPIEGFDSLLDILGQVRNLSQGLRAAASGPQDKRR